jgi:hypothetical protein
MTVADQNTPDSTGGGGTIQQLTPRQQAAIDAWLPALAPAKEGVRIWEAVAAATPADADPENDAVLTVQMYLDGSHQYVTELIQTLRSFGYTGPV